MITRPDWVEMAQAMARDGKSVAHIHRTLERWFQACLNAGETNDNERITDAVLHSRRER